MKNNLLTPKGWKWLTLEDIGIIVSGGTPSTNDPEFWDGDIAWVTPADLSNYNDVYISKGKKNISRTGLDYSSAILLPKNTILYSSRAPIGYVAITNNELATNQGFKNLIISEYTNSKYVFYYLKTTKELAESYASGTTFLELSATKFKQIPFPLAPLEEQERIVEKIEEIFSGLDKVSEVLKNSVYDLDNLWQRSLNKEFSILKYNYLGDVADIKGGKRLPKNTLFVQEKTDFQFIRITNLKSYLIDSTDIKYINKETFEKLINYVIEPEDIYISITGSIGIVGAILNNIHNAVLTDNAARIVLKKEQYLKEYLIYYLNSVSAQEQIKELTEATSQPKLALYKVKKIKIPLCSLEEQKKVVVKLDDARINCLKLKDTITKSIEDISKTKSKILQESFQGKLSQQLSTDTSTEIIRNYIDAFKRNYFQTKSELSKNYKKVQRKEIDIYQVIENNFKNSSFDYLELLKLINIPHDKLSAEFDSLLNRKKIQKIIERQSGTIKYKLHET